MTQPKKSPPPPAAGVARVPMKSTLPDKELQRYRDIGSVIELKPGETLFEQGSDPDEMYAVLRGTLAVIMDGVQVAEIGEGQVAGEMAFILGERRTATLRALDNCEVHAISPQKMKMLMQHPDVAFGLLQMFSRRVEAANRALLVRTQTALNDRLALEEERRQAAERLKMSERIIAANIELQQDAAEAERLRAAAVSNLEAADARIAQLEAMLPGASKAVRVFSPPVEQAQPVAERSALELEIDDELDALAPPPAPEPPPLPIGKLDLKKVATPRPKPAPVFSEEGPTDVMEALPEPTAKKRRDETVSYRTERAESSSAKTEVYAEVRADEVTVVVEEPRSGPIQVSRQGAIPVGGRTQTMMAFDPNALQLEIVIDDDGSRISSEPAAPTSVPPPAEERSESDRELDHLLAEMIKNEFGKPQR